MALSSVTDAERRHENLGSVGRDSPHTISQSNITYRIPPELLGYCFSFLPLNDCIQVSHVSRHWRAVALSTPSAWAHISMDCDDESDMEGLITLLSRTGEVPVTLRFTADDPISEHAFSIAALPHLHHLRYLQTFACDIDASTLVNAPMLRYLLVHDTLEIPDNFLGEQASSLRSLFFIRGSLPNSCPSLSMLVALHVRELDNPEYAASFSRLFHICPRLEFLSLSGLQAAHATLLPLGPAPPSLKTLFLSTREEDYDLTPRYTAWKTPNLRHVVLGMGKTHTAYPISQDFLDGAVTLGITLGYEHHGGRSIVADFPDGRKHALGVSERDISQVAEFVANVLPSLRHVHTLSISLDAVNPFFDVLANLPALRHLTVCVDWEMAFGEDDRAFLVEPGLDQLDCLVDIADSIPHLESLLLQMGLSLSLPGCAINGTDADNLVTFLDSLGPLSLPEMVIQGFTPDALEGLDPGWLDRLQIRFDTEGMEPCGERFDRANADSYWPFGYNG
ncbi:hypothetical protein AURDEDRAFT_188626, partial [Auricularia subglabra TFB-10046 SS5]